VLLLLYQKMGNKKSIWVHHGCLVSALAALKDESNTGTIDIVCSVGDKERVLLKMSGN